MMSPFEPAPLKKVLSADIAGIGGCGKRVIIRLECGHVITSPLGRHKDQKFKRCKQCREEA